MPQVIHTLVAIDAVRPATKHTVTRTLTDPDAPGPDALLADDPLAFDLATYAGAVACGTFLRHSSQGRPRWVMGHSVGDIAALAVAEAITPATGARILHTRHTLLRNLPPPAAPDSAGMLALALPVAEVTALLAVTGLHHTRPAGDNAPGQTVVSGPSHELKILHALARTAKIRCTRLASRTGYHHPHLSAIAEEFHTYLRTVDLRTPTVPLYSSALAGPVHTPARLRELAGHHLTRPVQFQASLHDLHRQGVNVFIDTGPGALLSPLVRATLPTATVIAPLRGHAAPHLVERRLNACAPLTPPVRQHRSE
ncbi:acyltransferase [Streptomyces longispororuber]|uniref:[acyl-carrier-protein] S-malonyltransferase n=1 Tax=Streptomyces longispororuber TaxID=68230 RepID=A0A918ZAV3_9ACTN|nr:acyltransferase domain-containing protein [Streptomyces longispororuber]GHE43684.1 acyltransferase [Streptomyces longispororuber]